jgi:hypothetical protein
MKPNFTRMTSQEYRNVYSCKKQSLTAPYDDLVELLGEPHKNGEPDYPDDGYKTDVCWGIRGDNGAEIIIWNYKNGPAYNGGEGDIKDINYWSVYYNDAGQSLFIELFSNGA